MEMDDGEETKKGKKKKKNQADKEKEKEEFMEDVGKDKNLRKYVDLYKDKEQIEKLKKEFENFGIDEKDKDDSDLDINLDQLKDDMENMNLGEKDGEEKKNEITSNEKDADTLGKRERSGKHIPEK